MAPCHLRVGVERGTVLGQYRWKSVNELDGSGRAPVRNLGKRGFGSRLIEGLARELDGKVKHNFEPSGVVCAIDFPI